MIYLIRTFGRRGKSMLKIGYSGNLQKRMDTYYHSNPFFETIGVREGSEKEEKKLHLYMELLGYKYKILEEWFLDLPEVCTGFHENLGKIDRSLWRNRNKVWRIEDFNNKLSRQIFEELYSCNLLPKKINPGTIDWDYKMMLAKELKNTELDYDIW